MRENAVKGKRQDLASAARNRAIELRAHAHGATSDVERECLEAIYAYEEVLSLKNGKKTPASRTWPMVKRHGILAAVERAVNRSSETIGYTALLDEGLADYAFEAVILRHPAAFSDQAVARSRARVDEAAIP